jgi:hypothetical protein
VVPADESENSLPNLPVSQTRFVDLEGWAVAAINRNRPNALGRRARIERGARGRLLGWVGNARNIGILARNLSNRASRRRLDCSLAAAAGAPSHFLMRFDSKKNDLFFIATDTQDFTFHLKNYT